MTSSTRSSASMIQSQIDPECCFTRLERIGKGSFGEVFEGIENKSQLQVAIKIIDMEEAEDEVDDIQQEIKMLSQCSSPYVTKYFGSYIKGTKLWIIMEYLGGRSAFELMYPGPFEETYIAILLREALNGLDYLHSQGKMHRDIKAANILLSETGKVKLADFGVAGQITNTVNKRNTFVGTPFWMAPEVIQATPYDYKADIWSLGITAYELATGNPPLYDQNPMKILFLIPNCEPPRLPNKFSKSFKDFVDRCLCKDPFKRATAKQLLKHPFIRNAKKTSYLIDLIDRYKRWKANYGAYTEDDSDDDQRTLSRTRGSNDVEWLFETVTNKSVLEATVKPEKEVKKKRPSKQHATPVPVSVPVPVPVSVPVSVPVPVEPQIVEQRRKKDSKVKSAADQPSQRSHSLQMEAPLQSVRVESRSQSVHVEPRPQSLRSEPEVTSPPTDDEMHAFQRSLPKVYSSPAQFNEVVYQNTQPNHSQSTPADPPSKSLSGTIVPLIQQISNTIATGAGRGEDFEDFEDAIKFAEKKSAGIIDLLTSEIVAGAVGPSMTSEKIGTAVQKMNRCENIYTQF